MHIAKIIGKIISTEKIPAYRERKLLLAQKLDLYGKPTGLPTMAIDYVGAGDGDIVILGAAPGLASTVFNIPDAPIRELVMGVIDKVQFEDGRESFGNSV
ncbi:MAG TPA: EutN/CcmL family microcompartment protein [Candidatus Sumerlaeota bacterium]|jgi:ethanolamine utilization protein EutN|nr:MAG: Carbon dioxide concentrating mechanism protein CcmL [candidate division BRC1 bacterium ADurb.Bin183]HOE64154.1 EutN/CcmL family microcompartment protein [Candidatus Sumerlaeota bacterium]HRR30474.1 EutN/CcmL family microcompartment protein [Candidatus Sumerlaeia bacterium]HON51060.1 EutN/CcmL family microcompartment protein [Candidatus Sumerlaeota bacterium]HOR65061.1 EutN/CcmL family microcompartment protein [Candidatus Sumerlaeota bacterium]